MSSQLGPLEIRCDAPRYPIVRACELIGLRSPLDVPWYHRGRYLSHRDHDSGASGLLGWVQLLYRGRRPGQTCLCGKALPVLREYAFESASGVETNYLLGQCPRCRAIFWQEP
jgi:hypothetical protein